MGGTDDPLLGSLSGFAPQLAETFVTVASDIALVVDLDGTVRSVAVGADSPTPSAASWVGRPWVETVTEPTRRKILRLLDEVAVSGVSRRCEVEHLLPSGAGVPVAYSAVRLGRSGPVLAAGRDLRAIAAIQQRFVQTQQQMERDYWKRREAETRYRRLFHVATDAVLVVDAATLRVVEGNPAAAERYGLTQAALAGRDADSAFDPSSRPLLGALFANARAGGQPAEIRAWLAGRSAAVDVVATPFRSADTDLLLVRMRAADAEEAGSATVLADFVERTPDAVAITDSGGRVLVANPAFAALCGVDDAARIEGRLLSERLAGPTHAGGDGVRALLDEVRRHGFVQRVAAAVRVDGAEPVAVEVSAAMLTDGDAECIGFTLRRADADAPDAWVLRARRDTHALLAKVGELPLEELLRQAAALAETHFLRRALAIAGGDRGEAARLLGIDRGALDRRVAALEPARPGEPGPLGGGGP